MRVFVGGVGQLYQGDLDFGRRFVESFEPGPVRLDLTVEELHYGAVAVSQRLEEVQPDALLLVGAEERRRVPGRVYRRVVPVPEPDLEAARASVESAATGYVTLDLVVEVIHALGSAPERIVAFELEPDETGPRAGLSDVAEAAIPLTSEMVRRELSLTPLLLLKGHLVRALGDGHLDASDSCQTLVELVAALDTMEHRGHWGQTFALRDRLRHEIASGETSENMSHLDWSLWWGLIEELDRLQAEEAAAG